MTWEQASGDTMGKRLLRVGVLCMLVLASSLMAIAKGNPEVFFNALLHDDQVSPLNQAFAALWLGEDLPRPNAILR